MAKYSINIFNLVNYQFIILFMRGERSQSLLGYYEKCIALTKEDTSFEMEYGARRNI